MKESDMDNLNADMIIGITKMCVDSLIICLEKEHAEKIFSGVESPGIELVGDFFEQITPLP